MAQVLTPIYEPKFSDENYAYRPHRSAKDAILKVKEYADEEYKYAVCLDLSKYFDTLNHELLMNMLRQNIKDKMLIELIKRYLKSGVMENGIVVRTEESSPQGGNLSPLLANIYLDKFDKGAYIRAHAKSKKKAKSKLRKLTSRSQGKSLATVFYNIRMFMRVWLGYYAVAEMKNEMERWNEDIGLLQSVGYYTTQ